MKITAPLAIAAVLFPAAVTGATERPLMRDFIGLNVHTVQFKPDLYAPVTRVLRNYHPLKWDTGDDTSKPLDFPFARNRVHWPSLYGKWQKAGYRTHASILFDDLAPAAWKVPATDARNYGREFARHFGAMLDAAEIGNEPGKYDDDAYRTLFEAMARGIREGDPKLKIATCAASLGKSGKYSKGVDVFTELEPLWDIVNIHVYAETEPWPTWRRSFPEDPAAKWLQTISHIAKWRDQHAKGKELWVTEFGYDAATKPPPATGDFSKWMSSTEEQQAMWAVRSFLLLPRMGVHRAHLYFFNDDDEAKLHGASGITRKFQPKPAFHSLAWLQRSLGDYRFTRTDRDMPAGDCLCLEFTHGSDARKKILAVWHPSGPAKKVRLFHDTAKIVKAERMPLAPGPAAAADVQREIEGYFSIEAAEHPAFVWLE